MSSCYLPENIPIGLGMKASGLERNVLHALNVFYAHSDFGCDATLYSASKLSSFYIY